MTDELLARATRALRESVDGSSDDALAAEERMAALLPRARRLRLVRPWGFSLAALLVGSSVWATSRGPLAPWLGRVVESVSTAGNGAPAKSVEHRVRNEAGSEQDNGTAVESLAALGPPPTRVLVPPGTKRVKSLSPPAVGPSVTSPPPETNARSTEALDLYERAHELHFVRLDYKAALTAWDRYLELAPAGALALEARFHRAVCLTRLGDKEAAQALQPFARGDYGTYRRAQAQKLLDGIRAVDRE